MAYSWSQMQTYLKCPRKHELAYFENLEKIPSVESESRLTGSVFHAGIAAALSSGETDETKLIAIAVSAARQYLKDNTVPNKTVKNYETGTVTLDNDYYSMVHALHGTIPELLRFYIPRIGLGIQYRVATVRDVFGADADTPIVEFDFNYGDFKGTVDALLIEIESGAQVLVDWKLRGRFPFDELAALDGQLPLYAAVLNAMGANITQTVMWQMRSWLPKPARLIKNDTEPSIAAQDTTWEYWLETLPPKIRQRINEDEWRSILDGKLKDETHYNHPIWATVDVGSSELAIDNALAVIELIKAAELRFSNRQAASAILSSHDCSFCDFWRLCSTVLKYGGDATALIETEYQPRHEIVGEDYAD